MLTVITDTAALAAAQQTFRENLLAAMPQRITCTVSGVGGGFSTEVAYAPEWDLWYAQQIQDKKCWNGFGIGAPIAGKKVALAAEIKQKALAWALGRAEAEEIDKLNILQASLLAMTRAVQALRIRPQFVLLDGNKIPNDLDIPAQAVVKGDSLVAEISAASILAKVARDQEMEELDRQYPEYAFAQHKGYPTKLHLENLTALGPLPQHRRSFAPVRKVLENR